MHRPPRRTAAASWLTSLGGGRAARGAGAAAGEAISNRPSWGSSKTSPEASHVWAGFFQDLRELGCVEGQNEGRFYGDRLERLPVLAAELVRLPVDAIVAGAAPAPEAAKRATSLIPIVFANHPIPSEAGSSPASRDPEGTSRDYLSSPWSYASSSFSCSRRLSLNSRVWRSSRTIHVVEARAPEEFVEAFSVARRERAGALIILGRLHVLRPSGTDSHSWQSRAAVEGAWSRA